MDSATGNPPEVDVDYDELQQPPSETPDFKDMFKELDEHHNPLKNNYTIRLYQ